MSTQAGLEGLRRVDSVAGRVFKHNFTYADETGRNVSLVYEAEHGEHVRIVALDDEAGLESFGGNATAAEIVDMTFTSAAHAESFHARVGPGDVLVGGAHWGWGFADAAASHAALLPGPSILVRVEDALSRSDAVVSARVRAVPLASLFRSATFELRVRLRPEDLQEHAIPREPIQTNGRDDQPLSRRELSFNTGVNKVGRFVERNTKKAVEEVKSFGGTVAQHLVDATNVISDALTAVGAATLWATEEAFPNVELDDLRLASATRVPRGQGCYLRYFYSSFVGGRSSTPAMKARRAWSQAVYINSLLKWLAKPLRCEA